MGENKGLGERCLDTEQGKRNEGRRAFLGNLKILSQRRGQNDLSPHFEAKKGNKLDVGLRFEEKKL